MRTESDYDKREGIAVIAEPISEIDFIDESDRKFYEVAKACNAILVTGNYDGSRFLPHVFTLNDHNMVIV